MAILAGASLDKTYFYIWGKAFVVSEAVVEWLGVIFFFARPTTLDFSDVAARHVLQPQIETCASNRQFG